MSDRTSATRTDLDRHPFLQGLGAKFLDDLVPHTSVWEYGAGAPIAREGDPAEEFFLVIEGKVALEISTQDRPRLTVLTVGPGQVFGWSWLVPPYRWRLEARCVKPTRTLSISAGGLRRAFDAHPTEAYHFLLRLVPVVAERLDATQIQVLDVHRP